jgi:WhiB family redox-sensing transcriptional regulator
VRKVVVTAELQRRVEGDRRFQAARRASAGCRDAGPEWREAALCTSAPDPDLFFPAGPEDLEPARRVCRTCPVAGACLAEALGRAEIDGVWGGTTSAERRTMRAVWRLASRPQLPAAV